MIFSCVCCMCIVSYRISGYAILLSLFFFQAEDGIRDLVRSRGLGDVYKRQIMSRLASHGVVVHEAPARHSDISQEHSQLLNLLAVSYTHLTLPTSDLV